MQYRRLGAIMLGIWLGAGIFADVAVTQNFQTVDRFLASPGSLAASLELNRVGRAQERVLLRRNAGEENNLIFENWERAELILGAMLLATLFFGERPNKLMLGAALIMWLLVLGQHFALSPDIADMGRKMADAPGDSALERRFWTYHGIYSGMEILKLLVGFGLAVRFCLRPKADPDLFAKEYAARQRRAVPQSVPGRVS